MSDHGGFHIGFLLHHGRSHDALLSDPEQALHGVLLFERYLDEQDHVQAGLSSRFGRAPSGPLLPFEVVARALPGEASAFPILVEEQALTPGEAGREGIADVVNDGRAGTLAGGHDDQDSRIALIGLVVEDHRVELGFALFGYG